MPSYRTPAVVVFGRLGDRLAFVEVDSGRREEVPVSPVGRVAELRPDGRGGHLAFASQAATLVKAAALDGEAYVLDVNGLRQLPRGSLGSREFGRWEAAWNRAIFLAREGPTLALGASRAGEMLHINVVRADAGVAAKVRAVAGVLQRFGELSLNCACRLGLMPVELLARRETRYVLAKFYLNGDSRRGREVLFIMGEGGNVLKRTYAPLEEAELAALEHINI